MLAEYSEIEALEEAIREVFKKAENFEGGDDLKKYFVNSTDNIYTYLNRFSLIII